MSRIAVAQTLYTKLNYNFVRDIAPVAGIMGVSNVVYVHPSVPAKTIPEFIAYAKTNPGKINMGSGGNGTSSHMAGELFEMMTGVNLVHVPYRGLGPAMNDPSAGGFCDHAWDDRVCTGRQASCGAPTPYHWLDS
jgi:tripartite-type tricarboxylate transporter receptor subunit TctC